MNQRRGRWGTLMWIFIVAVVMNDLWELAQASLYVGLESYNTQVLWHCFVASLGDGLMVLLIYMAGWMTLRRWDWIKEPRVAGYLLMLTAGLLLAGFVEWFGVRILERWQYTQRMPIVPGFGIGVVPLVQMLFLPPMVFRIACFLAAKE